jgi:mono/diheme cytochrome c family protein
MPHRHFVLAAALLLLAGPAAADPARNAILADLAAQAKQADAGFAAFSADRGAAFFQAKQVGSGDPKAVSCSACHTNNPKLPGQTVKTGKPIDPMAVSANPARFTNKDDVEKWFRRNCKEVLGRECTPIEKGDFITFMASQ